MAWRERSWSDVKKGDRLQLKGQGWTVEKAKAKGKKVRVAIVNDGRPPLRFEHEVKAKDRVQIDDGKGVDFSKLKVASSPEAERFASANRRAASKAKAERGTTTFKSPEVAVPRERPEFTPGLADWTKPEDKAEKTVREHLGGVLLAVKPEGSDDYVLPLVGPDTIASHLYVFHGMTPAGVSLEEARKYEHLYSAEEALQLVAWESLRALHDAEHAAFEAGTRTPPVPHWHEEKRPALQRAS